VVPVSRGGQRGLRHGSTLFGRAISVGTYCPTTPPSALMALTGIRSCPVSALNTLMSQSSLNYSIG